MTVKDHKPLNFPFVEIEVLTKLDWKPWSGQADAFSTKLNSIATGSIGTFSVKSVSNSVKLLLKSVKSC